MGRFDGGQRPGVLLVVLPGLLVVRTGQRVLRLCLATIGRRSRVGHPLPGFEASGLHLSLQPLLDVQQLAEPLVKGFVGRHVRHGEPPLRS